MNHQHNPDPTPESPYIPIDVPISVIEGDFL